jgi:hypothetical protein
MSSGKGEKRGGKGTNPNIRLRVLQLDAKDDYTDSAE